MGTYTLVEYSRKRFLGSQMRGVFSMVEQESENPELVQRILRYQLTAAILLKQTKAIQAYKAAIRMRRERKRTLHLSLKDLTSPVYEIVTNSVKADKVQVLLPQNERHKLRFYRALDYYGTDYTVIEIPAD